MGITRGKLHKRRATGGRRKALRMKRKFELGRPAAMTRIGGTRIHDVRVRGGHIKKRALRLDTGCFTWTSEGITKKTRLLNVVYNASNNELVRTNTLVKNSIIQIDATPFRQWYKEFYGLEVGKKRDHGAAEAVKTAEEKALQVERQKLAKLEPAIEEQFQTGRLLAAIASRPGQTGSADGYVLEGPELEFYSKKIMKRKK